MNRYVLDFQYGINQILIYVGMEANSLINYFPEWVELLLYYCINDLHKFTVIDYCPDNEYGIPSYIKKYQVS